MTEVEDYILGKEGQQRAILQYLHDRLGNQLALRNNIRYKIPFYYHKGRLCYMNPIKNDGIELVFVDGQQLSNVQNLLEVKDRKHVAGISLYSPEEMNWDVIHEVVQEAILLNEIKQQRKEER